MSKSNRAKLPTTKVKPALTMINPNAAGIDIGSTFHMVAVPSDRDDQPVQIFTSFTAELHRLADWLTSCGITTVAMESTGAYWIPLYELLDARGFSVLLVNARHVKNVTGRKSDVLDCQWLQQLSSYGLLRGAFRPTDEICVLRSLARQRATILRQQAQSIQRMQKALTQMNIQLANVIADIVGLTGQRILRAILAGERNPKVLAAMRHARIQASEEEITLSLQGNWRIEHLFALKQAVDTFDFFTTQLAECDAQIERQLLCLHRHDTQVPKSTKPHNARNAPSFDLHARLFSVCGVDLTRINGIDVATALVVLSEIGPDMARFPSDKHFTSWLGLCPGTKISGGKVLSSKTKPCTNRAAAALRLAAASLRSSKSALGAYFRRLCSRMDKAKAITAAAHKLARLIYAMLTKGQEFVDRGQEFYEEQHRQKALTSLQKHAQKLGMKLIPATESVS